MAQGVNIAVVGATTLTGESLLEILEERSFPLARVTLLDTGDAVGETRTLAGKAYAVTEAEGFDFHGTTLAFFCGGAELSRAHGARAAASGAIVIDASEAFRRTPEVPLVVPEVNGGCLEKVGPGSIVASPNAIATFLALVLAPLAGLVEPVALSLVTFQSVSGQGRAAVEELARQAVALFNQQRLVSEVFPKQIAFNLHPSIGGLGCDGRSTEEEHIATEARRLLGMPDLPVEVSAVRVPVFYGHAVAAHVFTASPVDIAAVRARLGEAPGVVLYEGEMPGAYPTPVVEAAGHDPVFVGRLRAGEQARGVNFWAVGDDTRKGSALNCVQIAEKLLYRCAAACR